MSPLRRVIGLLTFVTTLAGCAAHRPDDGSAARRSASGPIAREELESARYATLYDAVLALRGRWLRPRGTKTFLGRPVQVQVIVDDMRMGGVEALRAMTSDNVMRITFIDPATAAQRWGGSHAQGTILVATHADGAPDTEPKR
ncbi:MAG: hypothetical protein ACJ79A_15390 [Gemmatimonadaceae bacterium]